MRRSPPRKEEAMWRTSFKISILCGVLALLIGAIAIATQPANAQLPSAFQVPPDSAAAPLKDTVTPFPTCPPSASPTRQATPAFTPGPGCGNPDPDDLGAEIQVVGNQSVAEFTKCSTTCSYPIGLAVYKRFDEIIDNQELYDYVLAVIPPNSTLTLTVTNP